MATPNYQEMSLDLALLLKHWEEKNYIDLVNDPNQYDEIAVSIVAPLIFLISLITRRFKK